MLFVYKTIVAIFFLCTSVAISAMQLNDSLVLEKMDHELNKAPLKAYEKIQSQSDRLADMTPQYKLWWLLRKAQAENLLYFFGELQKTVAIAQELIDEKTPAHFTTQFNVFQGIIQQRAKENQLQLTQQKQENIIQTYIVILIVVIILFFLIFMFFQRRYNQKIVELSIRDPLADLYNRRYIFQFLNKLVSGINLEKNQISIMLIDIDDFKAVNDLYGHSFGDSVIKEVAKISKDTLRIEDVIGRVGGEEFLCVLPRIDSKQCLHIAQRLVNNVNKNLFFVGEKGRNKKQVNISVSVGISTTSVDTINSSDLYLQADKALCHAKANGKGRAVQYRTTMQHSYLQQD